LTAVEKTEEQLLAATTARAVEAAQPQPVPPAPAAGGTAGSDGGAPAETPGPADATGDMFQATEGRWGSREVEITDVTLPDGDARQEFIFHSGDPMSVRLTVLASHPTDDFVFGVGLFNADGMCCYGTNTYLEDMNPVRLAGTAEVTFVIDSLDLVEGTYKLDVAVHKRD